MHINFKKWDHAVSHNLLFSLDSRSKVDFSTSIYGCILLPSWLHSVLCVEDGEFIKIHAPLLPPSSPQHIPNSKERPENMGNLGRCSIFLLRGQSLQSTSGLPKRCPQALPAHHNISSCLSKHKSVINVMIMLGSQGLDSALAPADGSGPAWTGLHCVYPENLSALCLRGSFSIQRPSLWPREEHIFLV